MFGKTLKTLSVICAGAAMMVAAPAQAAIYIIYWGPDNTVIGSEVYNDYGQYCGLYGQTSGIYTVVEIPYTGAGCP
jgi:hypothetical protein